MAYTLLLINGTEKTIDFLKKEIIGLESLPKHSNSKKEKSKRNQHRV